MNNSINLFKLLEDWDSDIDYSESSYYTYYETMGKYAAMWENIKNIYDSKWKDDWPFPAGLTPTIESWLGNFKATHEQKVAFHFLPRIMVYSKKEMEVLCDIAFKKLIKSLELKLHVVVNASFFNNYALIVPLTDSGGNWCRHLRHKNSFDSNTVKQSINELKIIDYSYRKHIIIIEDFVGSGTDAIDKYQKKLEGTIRYYSDVNLYLIALIATEWGVQAINTQTKFNVITGELLDSRYKCFSRESVVYQDTTEKTEAKRIFSKYGHPLCQSDPEISGFPLGFGDSQLPVVLCDNTPDDSLPVIWYPEKNWFPIFKRNRRYHSGTSTI